VTFPFFGDLLGFFGGFGFTPTSFFVSPNVWAKISCPVWAKISWIITRAAPLHPVAEDQEASQVQRVLVRQLGTQLHTTPWTRKVQLPIR
jgi:hypothetical protein